MFLKRVIMIINKNTVETKYQKLYDLNNESIGIPIFQRFYA